MICGRSCAGCTQETKQTVLSSSAFPWGATIVLRAVEHESGLCQGRWSPSPLIRTRYRERRRRRRISPGAAPSFWKWTAQPKGQGTRKAALRGSGRDSAARQAAGRSRHIIAISAEDVQRAIARGAVQHDPHVWCCWRCQGSPQHQHRAAHDAARVGPVGLVCGSATVGGPRSLCLWRAGRAAPRHCREGFARGDHRPRCTVRLLPDAGHMVHFDQPQIVRAVVENA